MVVRLCHAGSFWYTVCLLGRFITILQLMNVSSCFLRQETHLYDKINDCKRNGGNGMYECIHLLIWCRYIQYYHQTITAGITLWYTVSNICIDNFILDDSGFLNSAGVLLGVALQKNGCHDNFQIAPSISAKWQCLQLQRRFR